MTGKGNFAAVALGSLLAIMVMLFGSVPAAHGQVSANTCSAALTASGTSYTLRIPYLVYSSLALSADLDLVPSSDGNFWFKLNPSSLKAVTGTAPPSQCIPAYLSSDLYLNLPEVVIGSTSFSASLVYATGGPTGNASDLMFKLTSGKAITFVTGNKSYAGGLTLNASEALVINNATTPTATTIEVQGDFVCNGDIDIWNTGATVRFNVSGNASLACNLRYSTDAAANTVQIVVAGTINLKEGFTTPSTGHVIVTDNASLIKSPDTYIADSTTDDGVTPSIMPTTDAGTIASVVNPIAGSFAAAPCTRGTHNLAGPLAPPANRRNISQGTYDGAPVVLAVWVECDVQLNNVSVDPPKWDPLPPSDRADKAGGAGRKGMTLNLRSDGKITFKGNSVMTLMDGGKGQDHNVTGKPAVAKAGNGGASGDLKIAAAGGIDFSNGTLTIIPGRGGDGGAAVATGTKGADGCPGESGGSATATGGNGADSKKVLKARGFDPTGKVFIGDVNAGHGGKADATGGDGGNGTPGKCNGGVGGDATAQAGKGGDASFRYSGNGAVTATTVGGNGGSAVSTSGHGGNGGNQPKKCDVGGDGAAGGISTAKSGVVGTGAVNGANGTASASTGKGDGGLCGDWLSSNGTGGTWSEYIAGVLRNNGQFSAGKKDCSCAVASDPKISVTPGEFVFTHNYGVSSCPQLIGSISFANSGTGSYSWSMGTLPAWLSASKTSGAVGDTVQLFFTCTGYSPSMSTSVSITGTNTTTGQALAQGASLPVSGAVIGAP